MTRTLIARQAQFAPKTNGTAFHAKGAASTPAESPPSDTTTGVTAPTTPPAGDPPRTAKQQLDDIDDEASANRENARSAVTAIGQLAAMFDVFMDQNDNCYINHQGTAVVLVSIEGVDIMRMAVLTTTGKTLTKNLLEHAQTAMRTEARKKAARVIYRRVGMDGDAYLIDLGDADRQCWRVDAQGIRAASAESLGVAFQRGKGYAELPMPVIPADAVAAWQAVQPLLNGLAERDHLPLIAAKVEHLRGDSPHPILAFLGAAGSGKTTVARHCMQVIDPFKGEPPSVAPDVKAITAAAQVRHSLLIDNVGGAVGGDIENTLCRSALMGATTVRELHTTADSRTLTQYAAWHMTGITSFLRQADTLLRTLVMRVSRPANGYMPAAQVQADFEADHPRILGGLLWFLSERMKVARIIQATQRLTHRMADWYVTGEAIAQSLGMAPGSFMQAQDEARAFEAREWLEGDSFAAPLTTWVQSMGNRAPVVAALPRKTALMKAMPWVGVVAGRTVVVAAAKRICDAVRNFSPIGGPTPPPTERHTRDALFRVQTRMTEAGWRIEMKDWKGGSNKYWLLVAPP